MHAMGKGPELRASVETSCCASLETNVHGKYLFMYNILNEVNFQHNV